MIMSKLFQHRSLHRKFSSYRTICLFVHLFHEYFSIYCALGTGNQSHTGYSAAKVNCDKWPLKMAANDTCLLILTFSCNLSLLKCRMNLMTLSLITGQNTGMSLPRLGYREMVAHLGAPSLVLQEDTCHDFLATPERPRARSPSWAATRSLTHNNHEITNVAIQSLRLWGSFLPGNR